MEFDSKRILLFLQRWQRGFFSFGHFGHQFVWALTSSLVFLAVTDFLGCGIPARLSLFELGDRSATLFVERQRAFRQRREPAPFQPTVKGIRMLANSFDVVHGGVSIRAPARPSSLDRAKDVDAPA